MEELEEYEEYDGKSEALLHELRHKRMTKEEERVQDLNREEGNRHSKWKEEERET